MAASTLDSFMQSTYYFLLFIPCAQLTVMSTPLWYMAWLSSWNSQSKNPYRTSKYTPAEIRCTGFPLLSLRPFRSITFFMISYFSQWYTTQVDLVSFSLLSENSFVIQNVFLKFWSWFRHASQFALACPSATKSETFFFLFSFITFSSPVPSTLASLFSVLGTYSTFSSAFASLGSASSEARQLPLSGSSQGSPQWGLRGRHRLVCLRVNKFLFHLTLGLFCSFFLSILRYTKSGSSFAAASSRLNSIEPTSSLLLMQQATLAAAGSSTILATYITSRCLELSENYSWRQTGTKSILTSLLRLIWGESNGKQLSSFCCIESLSFSVSRIPLANTLAPHFSHPIRMIPPLLSFSNWHMYDKMSGFAELKSLQLSMLMIFTPQNEMSMSKTGQGFSKNRPQQARHSLLTQESLWELHVSFTLSQRLPNSYWLSSPRFWWRPKFTLMLSSKTQSSLLHWKPSGMEIWAFLLLYMLSSNLSRMPSIQ